MFTGIITHLGVFIQKKSDTFFFKAPESLIKDLSAGDSIAVSGVCLTVVDVHGVKFSVNVMPETSSKTMFSKLVKGEKVNLERPLKVSDRLDGHIVQGHVEDVGVIISIAKQDDKGLLFTVQVPESLSKYVVSKGSIAVNGVSLTVIDAWKNLFSVGIIPYTFSHTMLHEAKVGDGVNIETDILAKYAEQFIKTEGKHHERCTHCHCKR